MAKSRFADAFLGDKMVITVENICKNYGKRRILDRVSFSARSGECIGIIGGNGCGKSTLLSILAGVRKCDIGSFSLDGTELFANKKKHSELVGYVPQGTPLLEELTALDNLRLWYGKEEMRASLACGTLKMLGADEFLRVRVNKLSGGMKKRLSIGCSVAHDPAILLLDEPTSALDLVCKEKIREYIMRHKENGGIILLSTHDEKELQMCDRLYIIKDGALAEAEFTGDIKSLTENF